MTNKLVSVDSGLQLPESIRRDLAPRRRKATARIRHAVGANRASSGWVIPAQANRDAASTPDYTDDRMFGDRCLRLLTAGGAAEVYTYIPLPSPLDVTGCGVRVVVKMMSYNATVLKVLVGSADLTNASTAQFGFTGNDTGAASGLMQKERFLTLDLPQSRFTASGTSGGTIWSALQRLQLSVTDQTGLPVDLRLHSIDFIENDPFEAFPNGAVVWTWDDSHPSQHSVVRPFMAARGVKFTVMPIPGAHGSNATDFMTDAMVRDLHSDGHEIAAHCYARSTHTIGLTALTQQQRFDEFEQCKMWQDSFGFYSSSHSYPLGVHDAATEADVAQYFATSRLATSQLGVNETATPGNRFALKAMNITQGSAAIGAAAVKAKAEKGVLFIMGHQVLESGGDANTVNLAALTAVYNAVAAAGVEQITQQEYARRIRV